MLLSEVRARPGYSLLVGVGLMASAIVVGVHLENAVTGYLMDLSVFRDAGWAFLHHTPLYTEGFHTNSDSGSSIRRSRRSSSPRSPCSTRR